ncbi:MAG: ABC transporter substrate-binding protein [Nitrospirota bacterium]
MIGIKLFFHCLVSCLCVVPLFYAANASGNDKIAVLISSSESRFDEALAGFKEYLSNQNIQAAYEIHHVSGDVFTTEQTVQHIRKSKPRMIFTLGSLGTEAVMKRITDIPVVACLVMRSDILKKSTNATGVGLEFPLETQFSWLKTILPKAKTIGVLYNPAENTKRIEDAKRIARRLGLRLEAVEVFTPQDIPSALATLARSADAIWGLADSLIMSPHMAKHILLFAFRNKIPLIGLSETWVKAGALYSLERDYSDLGSQCGSMALQIWNNAHPRSIAPATPRKIFYSINLKTAEHIKLLLPDEIVQKARTVY